MTSPAAPKSTKPSKKKPVEKLLPEQHSKDDQLACIINDNEARLWFITKYGKDHFEGPELKTLIEVRKRFRDDRDTQLTVDEEIAYRKATMAAVAFLGDRQPEAIRLYAASERRTGTREDDKRPNPLKRWMVTLLVVLVISLLSNGYQALLGKQLHLMEVNGAAFAKERNKLRTTAVTEVATLEQSLVAMCEQTLVYRASAYRLQRLVLDGDDASGNKAPPDQDETARKAKGKAAEKIRSDEQTTACTLIRDLQGGDELPEWVTKARQVRIAPYEAHKRRLKAEVIEDFLSLVLLPIGYALLGALTAAIRTVNAEFRAMTLTRVEGINVWARVFLGLVGGATIGILFSSSTLEGAGGLTVLGLSFAVGYAVDLFFNLLDAVKVGLGGSVKQAPESQAPTAKG